MKVFTFVMLFFVLVYEEARVYAPPVHELSELFREYNHGANHERRNKK